MDKFTKTDEITTFRDYANYYDLIYQDKDYKDECDFLESIFSKYSHKRVKTILDLGCGTGEHALILAERGYKITGVDMSGEMLRIAKKKAKQRRADTEFLKGDIRSLELDRKFDAVIAMFAVIGYQTTNEDFEKAILTARKHLRKDGLFTFDVWFGPAVLHEKPGNRKKVMKEKGKRIVRETRCKTDLIKQIVEVYFKVKQYKRAEVVEEIKETHSMRFFFPQEIEYFMKKSNFKNIFMCPFMEIGKPVSEESWNVTVVAVKNEY